MADCLNNSVDLSVERFAFRFLAYFELIISYLACSDPIECLVNIFLKADEWIRKIRFGFDLTTQVQLPIL